MGNNDKVEPPPIVALACSAGGLPALHSILGALPPGFPAAVVVLQHQPPDRPSLLARVLGRGCALPVRAAEQDDVLHPGTVYVVPAGHHAIVTRGNSLVLLTTNKTPPYRPSADLLITSLALTAPERSIAVVLSGRGHDGATGAAALHEFGGTVIASDRASSAYFDMPEAWISRDEVVDFVVPLHEIAPLLVRLVTERLACGGLTPA